MLEVRALNKYFGGLAANRSLDLHIEGRQIHALIGPNGAGKSTLVAQIAGELRPDSGQIIFKGDEITHDSVEHRCRAGLGRMFQTTSLFSELSILDNLRIALMREHARPGNILQRFWRRLCNDQALTTAALERLRTVGIDHPPEKIAASLSHGEQRQLEMAITLATSPDCLLLDEPMAGLSGEEALHMRGLIKQLGYEHAILLIEHDMQAVFELADTISVLVEGRIIASGTADDIRTSHRVQQAYLGEV